MEIRVATVDDIDRMMEVYAEGRLALGALGIDQWQEGYPQRWRVEGDVERGESIVAVDGGIIVGCAMVTGAGETDYDEIDGAWLTASDSQDPVYAVVHRVTTAADARGAGVASALFSHAETIARDLGRASLRVDTHPGNVPMQNLLGKLGYARCGDIVVSCTGDMSPERVAFEKLLAASNVSNGQGI